MKELAALLQGIAALAWPVVVLVVALMFRNELKLILTRIRRGKFLGSELELGESLRSLEARVEGTDSAVPSLAQLPTAQANPKPAEDDLVGRAGGDPKIALVLTASAIERELREILAVTGLHEGRFNLPSRQMLRTLEERGMIPINLSETIDSFWVVRNKIVHAHAGGASNEDAVRALDSGLALLRMLRAVPRATYVVANVNVPVYFDAAGSKLNESAQAVILEERGPGGVMAAIRVYPTTRAHFQPGKHVAWEWDPARTFPESWYRDPVSGEIKYGWTESMEFTGRLLDDL